MNSTPNKPSSFMAVPDGWATRTTEIASKKKRENDEDEDVGAVVIEKKNNEEEEKNLRKKKRDTKSLPRQGKVGEEEEEEEEENGRGKASGRTLGRRRRAAEKRKRTKMKKNGGRAECEKDALDDDDDGDDDERVVVTNSTNNRDGDMSEKQRRKAEKNRARKLRREFKKTKEKEEVEPLNKAKNTEVDVKRMAKDYVEERAKKRAKKLSASSNDDDDDDDDDDDKEEIENEKEKEKDDVAIIKTTTTTKKIKLSLIDKMRAKLSGGHFRMLNEQLYTTKGDAALELVKNNPGVFDAYHEGFREQVKKWPKNPVHKCFEWLQHKPSDCVVADFGCGDAELAKLVGKTKTMYSLDLETPARAPFVIACNMANTPLESNSIDVVVFSLSLMGTDYHKFIEEASRVLKVKGILWIAEVKSRFDGKNGAASIPSFLASLKSAGFEVKKKVDESDKMFFVLEAIKIKNLEKSKVEWPKLKACEYKKR
jgi:ribosomal RNA-processing protein 8